MPSVLRFAWVVEFTFSLQTGCDIYIVKSVIYSKRVRFHPKYAGLRIFKIGKLNYIIMYDIMK